MKRTMLILCFWMAGCSLPDWESPHREFTSPKYQFRMFIDQENRNGDRVLADWLDDRYDEFKREHPKHDSAEAHALILQYSYRIRPEPWSLDGRLFFSGYWHQNLRIIELSADPIDHNGTGLTAAVHEWRHVMEGTFHD